MTSDRVRAPGSQIAAIVIAFSFTYVCKAVISPPINDGCLIDAVFSERRGQRKNRNLLIRRQHRSIRKVYGMAGKSPVTASDEQRGGLLALADSRDRGEADRARAVLLTLAGWTSSKIAEAFGVREDTVRLWRSDFTAGGVAALKTSIAPGPPPVKSEAALRVVTPLLEEPVADRRNWTIPRLRAEIEAREGVRISRSQLSKALRKKSSAGGGPGTR